MITNIVIAGVGGQGVLLASKILGSLALELGLDVKVSEIHGMAQRGGSVITHVRIADIGETIAAPLVTIGQARVMLAFEPLEALRTLPYLVSDGGLVISNSRPITPMTVLTGAAIYPNDIKERLCGPGRDVIYFDAQDMADRHGAPRAVNTSLLGALAAKMSYSMANWESAIKDSVPAKSLDANLSVFFDTYETTKG